MGAVGLGGRGVYYMIVAGRVPVNVEDPVGQLFALGYAVDKMIGDFQQECLQLADAAVCFGRAHRECPQSRDDFMKPAPTDRLVAGIQNISATRLGVPVRLIASL